MLRAGSPSHFKAKTKMTGEESAGTIDFSGKCVFDIEGNNNEFLRRHTGTVLKNEIARDRQKKSNILFKHSSESF